MSFNISYNFEARDDFSPVLRKISSSFTRLRERIAKTSIDIGKVSEKMSKIGRGISLKFGAPLAAATTLAIKKTKDFDLIMNEIAQTTGYTAAQMNVYRKMATKANYDTEFSLQQVAQAQLQLTQGNVRLNNMQEALNISLATGSAYHIETADAARTVTDLMKGYHMQIGQVNKAMDYFGVIHTRSGASMTEMSNVAKRQSKVLIPLGVSFKDFSLMLGTFSDNAISARSAGTGIAEMFQYMNKPTTDALKIMKLLGIHFKDLHGKILPIRNIIDQFAAKQKYFKDKGLVYGAFFGQTAAPLFQALVDNRDDMSDLAKAFDHARGTTDKLAESSGIGLPGALYRLSASYINLNKNLVETQETGLTRFINKIAASIQKLSEASPATKKWITDIVGLGIVFGPVMIALAKFLIILRLLGVGSVMGLAIKGVKAFAISLRFLWVSGALPLVIIAAIGYAIYKLYKRFTLVRAIVKGFGKAMYIAFLPIIWPIKETIKLMKYLYNLMHKKTAPVAIQHRFETPVASPRGILGTVRPTVGAAGLAGATQQTMSTLNINVNDPTKIIKSMHGESTADQFNMAVGQNMSLARI